MDIFVGLIVFIFGLWILWFLITLPAVVAEKRGVDGEDLSIIKWLSWFGLLFPILWVIGLIFALLKRVEKKSSGSGNSDLERLEKLHDLLKKKIITQDEFYKERKKLIG